MKLRYLTFASLVLAVGVVQAGGAKPERPKTILLACVMSSGFTYAVEIDEVRNTVLVGDTPATKVLIDKNQVLFDIELAGTVYSHSLSRLNGKASVSSEGWTTPTTHTCNRAAPKF